jgi:hypothetical protein
MSFHQYRFQYSGTATRYCDTQGEWEAPNLVNCTAEAFVNASKQVSFQQFDVEIYIGPV